MFKKLSDIENSMYHVMEQIKNSNDCNSVLNSFDIDDKNALHECLKNGYVENIDEYADGDGCYHFQSLGNVYITQEGFAFIRDVSVGFRFKNAIFDVLKGTLGFVLGILSTIVAEIIVWLITTRQ